ncbi:hypothetical protein YC2023_116199 [Brassica napus]
MGHEGIRGVLGCWASQDSEDKDVSTSLKTKAFLQTCKTVSEARASLWEKVEKANHMARWENNQKVEVEKVKGRLQDRLMKRLAAVECKAKEK